MLIFEYSHAITLSNIDANYEIQMLHAKMIPYLLLYWIFGMMLTLRLNNLAIQSNQISGRKYEL
jgi:hypothetical protein